MHTPQSTQAPPCLVFVSIIWCHCAHTKETWSQHGKHTTCKERDGTNQSTLCGIQQWHTSHHNHPQTNGLPQHVGTTNNTMLTKPSVSTTTPFSITCVFAPLFGVVVSQHIKTIHRLSSHFWSGGEWIVLRPSVKFVDESM